MARKPPPRRPAGPTNVSRAAGAPATASAAATEPMEDAHTTPPTRTGFYQPADDTTPLMREPESPLAAVTPQAVHETVRAEAIRRSSAEISPGLSADLSVVESAAAEGDDSESALAAEIARIRATRKPLGAYTQKLALPKRRGYHRHWFNDVAGRIDDATANGWTHVKGTDGKPIARVVGTGRDKGALYAYAMEIPLVFWEEDQNERHAAAAQRVEALKAAPFRAPQGAAKPSDKGKFYDPSEGDVGPLQVVKT